MKLNEFLVKAKIATYATEGETNEIKLDGEGRELSFEEKKFKYRDVYYGSNPFSGEEVVWKNNEIYWSMNYYGKMFGDVNSKKCYNFLKKAMRQVTKERPFRGPKKFVEEDWKYIDSSKGTIENFIGKEEIYFSNKKVYELNYHGGLIR